MKKSPIAMGLYALSSTVLMAASVDKPAKDNSVAAEQASFTLSEGYEINCFASEKDGVTNPVTMQWDAKGRLWVLTTLAYPQLKPTQNANDKLIILEDTDNDGKADKTTVFLDGLNMPTGFVLGDGGVYIGAGTELIFAKDTDGDDKADQQEVVYSGFGTGDTHQNINSLVFSPGGELYFNQGLHSFSRIETPWGIETLDEYGTWRMNTKSRRLESFSRTGGDGNPWGLIFDKWGQPFIKSNGTSVHELQPGLIKNSSASYWGDRKTIIGHTKVKSMEIEIVDSPHMPKDIQGDVLICGYMSNDVYRMSLQADGSGHKLKALPSLLSSANKSFRPVNAKIGPDGALYIADWYNPIIGHYQASFRHPDRDKTHGRIWRITAKDRPLVQQESLANLSNEKLIAKLNSKIRWEQVQAGRVLRDRPAGEVAKAVKKRLHQKLDDEHEMLELFTLLESHEIFSENLFGRLLKAKDHRARGYATREIARWQSQLKNPLELLDNAIADAHPRVRMEALVALTEFSSPEAVVIGMKILDREVDVIIKSALERFMQSTRDIWSPGIKDESLQFAKLDHVIYLLAHGKERGMLPVARKLMESGKLKSKQQKNVIFRILAESGNASELAVVLKNGFDQPELLKLLVHTGKSRKIKPAGDLESLLRPSLESKSLAVQIEALNLVGIWKLKGLAPLVAQKAASADANEKLREAALIALPMVKDDVERILQTVASSKEAFPLRIAALKGLVDIDLKKAAASAAQMLTATSHVNQVRPVMAEFLAKKNGDVVLAQALATIKLDQALTRNIHAALGSSGKESPAIQKALASGAADANKVGNPKYSADYIANIIKEAKANGNIANGKRVYEAPATTCITCHKTGDLGGILGPDLSAVGAALSDELLVESILWPKRQVKEGYISTSITTKDGLVLNGYVDKEEDGKIVLRDAVTQKKYTLTVADVAKREDAGTLMPSGLTSQLTHQELRDMIAYLRSLRK